ncbi:hypothetical protein BJ138DRAFT_1118343 [Hygrophoropsis aurantiaca]|uniref:Uncharacterized protein n=1 Tax=Hygrophoropsis aurantiaca TaxID=72124 RepID=A0ACB7ZZ03_9AGAM|nr:hypothetical protein BJ138DRAFT_1118343 [Hygrophoropsis aurantiaca]
MPQVISRVQSSRRDHSGLQIPCGYPQCNRWFKTTAGRTKHRICAHPELAIPAPALPPSSPEREEEPSQDDFRTENPEIHDLDQSTPPLSPLPEVHTEFYGPGNRLYRNYHTKLTGQPCDAKGDFLPIDTPPLPLTDKSPDDWTPYRNRVEFETAEFLYTQNQMAAGQIDKLLDLWAATLIKHGEAPPFADHRDLYSTIDNTPLGDVKWQNFSINYTGEKPEQNMPPWMLQNFDVWYRDPREVIRNMLASPDYANEMDYRPFREYSTTSDERQYQDFMSGDWAWNQADTIAQDPDTHGSTFVPVILGSDKTTVSVATGQNEYYPLYVSIGNIRNNVRRAHRDAVAIIGFLAIPKTTKEHASDEAFRRFRRQLFHCSLSKILGSLKPAMTKPEVARFGDGHYRKVIYGLGPYIADYEEQVLLACIVRNWCPKCMSNRERLDEEAICRCEEYNEVLIEEGSPGSLWDEYGIISDLVPFTNDFPRADIHELIAPDILHQLIKGTFKDHLVDWVEKYLKKEYGNAEAQIRMDDIDRRIAAVASFSGLRRFPQGRGFKQWTGDDSKALMKVYLPAIEGHVPPDVVRTFRAFLEFCYLVRRNIITETTLKEIEDALKRFHHYREIFKTTRVVFTFSLPRQHSLKHYPQHIQLFGAPNGLCSSITESKHIKAVKEPWRRSSRFEALGQMLVTNQRLDKIAAARTDFTNRGMLQGTCLSNAQNISAIPANGHEGETNNFASRSDPDYEQNRRAVALDNDYGEIDDGAPLVQAHVMLARTPQSKRAQSIPALATELNILSLPALLGQFLYQQAHPNDDRLPSEYPSAECPQYEGRIHVFNSASSRFYAPSDLSGIGGMRTEHIRACPSWRNQHSRHDCVFVSMNPELTGFRGLEVARVLCFFSFKFHAVDYPCAVVRWFNTIDDSPDEDTGMWMVRPGFNANRTPNISIIHVDTIYRAAHLIPIYGSQPISREIKHYHSYDAFRAFYVNKYADHHAFEIAF